MIVPFRVRLPCAEDGSQRCSSWPLNRPTKDEVMKWETPEAVDFRFGMEITMYVANR